jgi:hypothetical protein
MRVCKLRWVQAHQQRFVPQMLALQWFDDGVQSLNAPTAAFCE